VLRSMPLPSPAVGGMQYSMVCVEREREILRSMPMPSPAVGGMPYSMAIRKSSSTSAASRSPAAFFAAYSQVRESWLTVQVARVMVKSTGRPLPSSPPIQ